MEEGRGATLTLPPFVGLDMCFVGQRVCQLGPGRQCARTSALCLSLSSWLSVSLSGWLSVCLSLSTPLPLSLLAVSLSLPLSVAVSLSLSLSLPPPHAPSHPLSGSLPPPPPFSLLLVVSGWRGVSHGSGAAGGLLPSAAWPLACVWKVFERERERERVCVCVCVRKRECA